MEGNRKSVATIIYRTFFFGGLSSGLKLIKYSKSWIRKNANVIHCATSFNEFINTRTEFIAHAIYAHGMRPRPLTIRLCHIHYAALISTFESSFLFHYASSVVVPFRTYALALAFFFSFFFSVSGYLIQFNRKQHELFTNIKCTLSNPTAFKYIGIDPNPYVACSSSRCGKKRSTHPDFTLNFWLHFNHNLEIALQ